MPSPGFRVRLQLFVTGAVALTLVLLVGAFNVILRDRLSHEADGALSARASGELALLPVVDGRLRASEAPDAGALDAQTWVFAGGDALEQPPSDPASAAAARALSRGPRRFEDLRSDHLRMLSVPVVAHGRRLGTIVVAESLRPYESTAQTALIASLVLGGVVLLLVAVLTRLVAIAALRPVVQMTARAAAWSEADTGRRFGVGPPRDELTQLAATLDQLLDRVATSLRHEQRFSAELSHELRTPLAGMIVEAQLALRHAASAAEHTDALNRILASARELEHTLDTLLAAARLETDSRAGTGDATAAIHAAARGYEAVAAQRGITIDLVDPERPIRIGVDTDVAQRVLAPLIENACRHGHRLVTVTAGRTDGAVEFRVADDGPGVPAGSVAQIFEPGYSTQTGAGLGLPLARRLARAAGGEVTSAREGPGAQFLVRLPSG